MVHDIQQRVTIVEMEIKQIKTEQSSILVKLDKLDERLRTTEKYMWTASGIIIAVNIVLKFIKIP